MADDAERRFVQNARVDHMYMHPFKNGEGSYFTVLFDADNEVETLDYEVPGRTRNRIKITISFIREKSEIKEVTLKKFKHYKNEGWKEQDFSPAEPFRLTHFSFERIAQFLSILSDFDLANVKDSRTPLSKGLQKDFGPEVGERVKAFLKQPEGLEIVKEVIQSGQITSQDIINLGYRKEKLDQFRSMLNSAEKVLAYAKSNNLSTSQPEKIWQYFFKSNEWIFGFGLNYRFFGILQDEAEIGAADLGGGNAPNVDFLAADNNFTVLVEVKRPDTKLVGTRRNRAGAWKLSSELFDAVSQILEQKARWSVRAASNPKTREGENIKQATADPKCILIIGDDSSFAGETLGEREMKLRTFELFRRDTRNIEILTYSELYHRAAFIVDKTEQEQKAT